MSKSKKAFHDPTQQAEGKAARWVNEPLHERHPSLLVHTKRPFNAEPVCSFIFHNFSDMLFIERFHPIQL